MAREIPAGTRTSVPVIGVDFYPTFVHLAKGETSGNPDGRDIFEVVKIRRQNGIYFGIFRHIWNRISMAVRISERDLIQVFVRVIGN